MKNLLERSLATACAALCLSAPAIAQDFPSKPFRIVVPYAAGGATDTTGRIVGAELEKRLGQPVVIDNVPGAGGVVGVAEMLNADPDGHTMVVAGSGALTTAPFTVPDLPYDPAGDFTYITHLVDIPMLFCVRNDFPANTMAEFIETVKAAPDDFTYGSVGAGASTRLAWEWFMNETDLKMIHIPYPGQSALIPELLNGTIDAAMNGFTGTFPFHKEGKIKCIGVSTTERMEIAPDIPTFVEAGYEWYTPMAWFMMIGPKNIPDDVLSVLNEQIVGIVNDRETSEKLTSFGFIPATSTPEEAKETVEFYLDTWKAVIDSGVEVR